MSQIVMNRGGDQEEIMDMVDAPEFVLVQMCDLTLRKQDMRNPDAQRMVREFVDALKVKAEKKAEPADYNRDELKKYIECIEEVLAKFA